MSKAESSQKAVPMSEQEIATPRVDRLDADQANRDVHYRWHAYAALARNLERELATQSTQIERLREALEWYRLEAEAIARHLIAKETTAVTASVQVLGLDAGNRARAALSRG